MYQFWPFQLTTWRNLCNNVVKSNLNKIQQEQLLTQSGTDGKTMIRFGCDKNHFIFNLGWVWFTCAPQGPRLYFVVFACKSFKGGGHKLWTVVSSRWTKALLLNVVSCISEWSIQKSPELRMLSRSLSDCKSLTPNVMIQVSQFVSCF